MVCLPLIAERNAHEICLTQECLQIVRHLLWKQTTTHSLRNNNPMFDGNLLLNLYVRLSTRVFYYLGEKQHNFQLKCVLNLQTNKWYDRKFKHKLALLVAFEAKETSERPLRDKCRLISYDFLLL